MPGGDGSGPMGMGPLTGRGAGLCAGKAVQGFANRWPGHRSGFGGRGGRRNLYYATRQIRWRRANWPQAMAPVQPSQDQEKLTLKVQADHLETLLTDIRRRLDELDGE